MNTLTKLFKKFLNRKYEPQPHYSRSNLKIPIPGYWYPMPSTKKRVGEKDLTTEQYLFYLKTAKAAKNGKIYPCQFRSDELKLLIKWESEDTSEIKTLINLRSGVSMPPTPPPPRYIRHR